MKSGGPPFRRRKAKAPTRKQKDPGRRAYRNNWHMAPAWQGRCPSFTLVANFGCQVPLFHQAFWLGSALKIRMPEGPGVVRHKDADFFLDRFDIRGLLALRTHLHVEADLLILLQRFETLCLDFGEMREQVFAAVVRRDESKTLRVVEPLHCSSCHHPFPTKLKSALDSVRVSLTSTATAAVSALLLNRSA